MYGKFKSKKRQNGFSLIELLIVMAIFAIVAALAMVAWRNYYQKLQFNKSVQVIVQELYRTRSDARRSSDNITLAWDSTLKQLQVENSSGDILRTVSLPKQDLTISSGSGQVTYSAPYGRVVEQTDQYIRLDDGKGGLRDILIIGVTGKIYQRNL